MFWFEKEAQMDQGIEAAAADQSDLEQEESRSLATQSQRQTLSLLAEDACVQASRRRPVR